MYVPRNYKDYMQEKQRLHLAYISSMYDFEFALVKEGFNQNTSILSTIFLDDKFKYQNFVRHYSHRFPTPEKIDLIKSIYE